MTETHDPAACREYARTAELSRRRFLGGVAGAGATMVATSLFGDAVRQASFGATSGGNVLVVISFRGGIDGLGLVVPHGDPDYYRARPTIAVPRESLIAKDSFFGLHPQMAPLQWMWDAGELAAVHAVGMQAPNRSHFDAMEEMEDADPASTARRGWVNRMVGLDANASPLEAVHLGNLSTPAIVDGPAPSVVTRRIADVRLAGATGDLKRNRKRHLNTTWRGVQGPLGDAARSALTAVATLQPLADAGYKSTVNYPRAYPGVDLSDALRDTAHLVKSDLGTEVVSIDFGSWDMHNQYGTLAYGDMQRMTGAFAQVLSAFFRDLGPLRNRVTVATISEFGRRVAENGNRGLDHGWGNMMLLAGAGVRGGRYYGSWPSLADGSLVAGDLQVTTDYRQVLGEVVSRRFPDKAVSQVFPGLHYSPLGVMAA